MLTLINIWTKLKNNLKFMGCSESSAENKIHSIKHLNKKRRWNANNPSLYFMKLKKSKLSITTNKAGRSVGIPVELFQILKDDAAKVLHSKCQQIHNTQQ